MGWTMGFEPTTTGTTQIRLERIWIAKLPAGRVTGCDESIRGKLKTGFVMI
jgi:hypothetical protein